jgi:hypothetical protein
MTASGLELAVSVWGAAVPGSGFAGLAPGAPVVPSATGELCPEGDAASSGGGDAGAEFAAGRDCWAESFFASDAGAGGPGGGVTDSALGGAEDGEDGPDDIADDGSDNGSADLATVADGGSPCGGGFDPTTVLAGGWLGGATTTCCGPAPCAVVLRSWGAACSLKGPGPSAGELWPAFAAVWLDNSCAVSGSGAGFCCRVAVPSPFRGLAGLLRDTTDVECRACCCGTAPSGTAFVTMGGARSAAEARSFPADPVHAVTVAKRLTATSE